MNKFRPRPAQPQHTLSRDEVKPLSRDSLSLIAAEKQQMITLVERIRGLLDDKKNISKAVAIISGWIHSPRK